MKDATTTIEEIGLTAKTYAVLKRNGVNFVSQLKEMNYKDVTSLKNINRVSVEEIEGVLGIEFS